MFAISRSLLLAAVAAAGCAVTQPAPEADSVYVVAGEDRASVPMAAWEGGGSLQSASGAKAAGAAPSGAVQYDAKLVRWPTATVKVLTFDKNRGGVLHPLTDETLIYVLEGPLQTNVGGKIVVLNTGDVASLPSGALRNAGAPADAVVVAWTAPSLTTGATPAAVRMADVEQNVLGGGGLKLRRYQFPGNSVRAVELGKGFKTNPNSAKTDSLIYVTKGPMRFFQNGQEFTVTKGDFIREVAGAQHNWDVTEESGFVTTSALPIGAGPIDPDKATDVPPQ